jgi:hypothetical protein
MAIQASVIIYRNQHIMNSQKKISVITSLFIAALLFVAPLHVIYADDSSTDASSTPATIPLVGTSTPITDSTAPVVDAASTTPDTGTTTPVIVESNTQINSEVATSSNNSAATSSPNTGTATITVRDGAVIAWHGTVSFPIGTSTTAVTPTNSSSTVAVSNQSLLGVLLNVENSGNGFSISDLAYYPSFGEFLVNCVRVPAASANPDCYDWQYEVNGTYPFSGIDQYQLHDGDQAYLYFGNPRKVAVSTTTVSAGTSFTATAESYDPATNTYAPTTGYTIGVTQPDPSNPWSPTEIATSTTDTNGNATFTLSTLGSYGIGLQEDYYSNLTPITVVATSSTASSTNNSGGSSNNSGNNGGGGSSNPVTANAASAFSFLTNHQNSDGSFNGSGITDWSALALALPDAPSPARTSLAHYLTTASPIFSITRDYERHALALMALGINPYSGSPQDTITPIVKAFNGTYIVDSLDDPTNVIADIFALIVLPHAGYASSDTIIQKTESFVLSAQNSDGSWYFGSTDITAAAIQALAPLPGTSGAIARAELFLHQNQQSNGGFSNSDSTSWVLNGLAAHSESAGNWSVGTSTPLTYLASLQQNDGGINSPSAATPDSRTWSTAYALTAFEGRSWSSLLGNFARPSATATIPSNTGSLVNSLATSTIATSSAITVATSSDPSLTTLLVVTEQRHATTTPVIHKKKHVAVKAGTESPTPFTISTSSIAAAINNRHIEAGAASAPGATSAWSGVINALAHLGSFFKHLI